MPELRTDWLTGRTVVVAENRAARPNEFEPAAFTPPVVRATATTTTVLKEDCPFCFGHESRTPTAVYEVADTNGQWRIRVVPNKYPAFSLTPGDAAVGECTSMHALPAAEAVLPPLCDVAPSVGAHEVIIESARHVDRWSALSTTELRDVLETYALRLRHWRGDERLAYGLVFKNQGERAGASLAHLHSQFIALPTIPPTVEAELGRAEDYYRHNRICPYCQLLKDEESLGVRLAYADDAFLAFCPFASLQPYEVWLMPTDHRPAFEEATREILDRLAGLLHRLVRRIESIVPDGAYNLLLRTAPWRVQCRDWTHWRIELVPRTTAFAGLELASGVFINPVAPERAASKLRSI